MTTPRLCLRLALIVSLALVPFSFCQAQTVLPLKMEERTLVVATCNPFESSVGERLAFLANRPIRWVLAPPEALSDAIAAAFNKEADADARMGGSASALDENAVVSLGRGLLVKAIQGRASDLHIQPYLGAAVVRIRIDGELRRLSMLPDALAVTLVRHLKAKCEIGRASCRERV